MTDSLLPTPNSINQSKLSDMEKSEKMENKLDTKGREEPKTGRLVDAKQRRKKMHQAKALNNNIHAWRNDHSIVNRRNPGVFKQMSQACRDRLVQTPTVIMMVGLPARGKTYMARKLARYLHWIGIKTKVFNVGDYRRDAVKVYTGNEFFNPDNTEAVAIRNLCAQNALEDMCNYLQNQGEVAIFDATNTTRERRRTIYNYCTEVCCFRVFFVESICNSPEVIQANIREVKLKSPDYKNVSEEEAVEDFLLRIELYVKQYEPIDDKITEKHYSFIKIYNCGERFLVHKIRGTIQSRVVYFLMNMHVLQRTIYLTRHGESEMNVQQRIGGDSPLSPAGITYTEALAQYIANENIKDLIVWTSARQQAICTAAKINAPTEPLKALNGINPGMFEGLTYREVAERYPEEFAARDRSKYYYRYPGGESYHDLVARLEPVIMELERAENLLVICHQAVARCILAYFLDKDPEHLPYIKVPLHTVIKLTPMAYGCMMESIPLSVEAVNTHRSKPKNCDPHRPVAEALNEFLEVRSETKTGPTTIQIIYQNAGTAIETTDAYGNRIQRRDSIIGDVSPNNSFPLSYDSII
ncbi:unnamed protein product [Rotaria sordida]|uniref:6-phosphofructo-2-kinase domain-containing protein n=1 Tax=Rotaria sordida TaxID=392033 RepID=A0A814YHG6_9BILA|nr:unnamed protein product [Rotaria sordida]CAF1511569.1 unnamed protein product [Rotaria sordida]